MTTEERNELVRLLKHSVFEINKLRKHNEIMSTRLDMFDKMFLLFTSTPQGTNHGMSHDLVWEIEKTLGELEKNK